MVWILLYDFINMIGYPSFCVAPDSKETQELKAQFLSTRQKIINYYKGKKFFESTLGLLIDQEDLLLEQKPSFL
jgi:hypothetical protein